MSSSDYPTINYNVFIPSNWTSSSSGFTEAQLNKKYLKFPIAQTYLAETLNNVNLTGRITTTNQSPLLIQNPLFNQVVGSNSNLSNITGGKNTSWGNSTFDNLSSGIDNTSVGYRALNSIIGYSENTAIGSDALRFLTTGDGNTAVGFEAGENMTINSDGNTFLGHKCGTKIVQNNDYNTFLGATSDLSSITSNLTKSTAVGYGAIITASNQVVLGTSSETLVIPSGIIQNTRTNFNTLIGSTGSYSIGGYNTCLGSNAMSGSGNASTENNTCVGYNSGNVLNAGGVTNKGSANSLFGRGSGSFLTSGAYNTFVGSQSGYDATTGSDNVCIGSGSGDNLIGGSNNTFIGKGTNTTLSTVSNSTAIGCDAQITANNQIVIGTSSEHIVIPSGIITNPRTSGNTFITTRSQFPSIGNNNTALGCGAIQSINNVNAVGNTAVGLDALKNINPTQSDQSTNNTAIGRGSGLSLTLGSYNTCLGFNAGSSGIETGFRNTFVGESTSSTLSNASKSTAIGSGATITASNQIVLGTATETVVIPSGVIQNTATTNGNYLFGSRAVASWVVGTDNTILGIDALGSVGNVNIVGNTCVGRNAGLRILATTTGQGTDNTCVGRNAGDNITTGFNNTCIGSNSGSITTGSNNVSINSTGITTGSHNVCIGSSSGGGATTSSNNVCVGQNSGSAITSGGSNVCIGENSGNVITTQSNNTCIGNGANVSLNTINNSTAIGTGAIATASNQIVLGRSSDVVIFPSLNFYGAGTIINDDITLSFPLGRVYAVFPSTSIASNLNIYLPTITDVNQGAIVTFRMVSTGGPGNNVIINTTGGTNNIYINTSNNGVNNHIIYTASSTILLTHTFTALSLGVNSYGWFQIGNS